MDIGQSHLCARCSQLGLTRDSFFVTSTKFKSPVIQDPEHYLPKGRHSDLKLRSPNDLETFASLADLRASSSKCKLCNLLRRCIERHTRGTKYGSIMCSLRWEIDGRQENKHKDMVANITRHLRVQWQDRTAAVRREVYLVLVATPSAVRPTSDAVNRWQPETQFLGRHLDDQQGKQALIKSWLDICLDGHRKSCYSLSQPAEFLDVVQDTFFGCIDVLDMQVKPLPVLDRRWQPYVALSYVWGRKAAPYVTNRSNVMAHILHGGLESAWSLLPLTIRDAITLTARLGYRYLWVDSLCIVQDSPHSWQHNAGAMNLVYGNAEFTICAADGDASSGLKALRTTLTPFQPGAVQHISSDDDETEQEPITCECSPGVRLLVTRHVEAVINDSLWNRRAWTFQERVLAPRCLIFAEGQVYFQCRQLSLSQDIYAGMNRTASSLSRVGFTSRAMDELQTRPFLVYSRYMTMYTGRQLTKAGDIMAAFQGVSSQLSRFMGFDLQFGLPVSHFDLAMLWIPTARVRRRKAASRCNPSSATCEKQTGECTCWLDKESLGGRTFPSWSWTGVIDGGTEYDSDMLGGCYMDVHEWLKHHTWIQWYLRDERGHLRPLENFISAPRFRPAMQKWDAKWQGYSASIDALQTLPSPDLPLQNSAPVSPYLVEDLPPKPYKHASPRELYDYGQLRDDRYDDYPSPYSPIAPMPPPPPGAIPYSSQRDRAGTRARSKPDGILKDHEWYDRPKKERRNVQEPPEPRHRSKSRNGHRRARTPSPTDYTQRQSGRDSYRSPPDDLLASSMQSMLARFSLLYRSAALMIVAFTRFISTGWFRIVEKPEASTPLSSNHPRRRFAYDNTGRRRTDRTTNDIPKYRGPPRRTRTIRDYDYDYDRGTISRYDAIGDEDSSSDFSRTSTDQSSWDGLSSSTQTSFYDSFVPKRRRPAINKHKKPSGDRTVRYDEVPTYLEPPPADDFEPFMNGHGIEPIGVDEDMIIRTDNRDYLRNRSYSREDYARADSHRRESPNGDSYQRTSNKRYLQDRSEGAHYDKHGIIMNDMYDRYGRFVGDRETPVRETPRFSAILPDFPFVVIRDDHTDSSRSVEYMPILQFFTWSTELHITAREAGVGPMNQPRPGSGLCHCDIVDRAGDWCGHIVLDKAWILARDSLLFRFIALSDAKAFTKDECPVWNYYIPKEQEECDWDLYFVMLLERDEERGVWERKGIGKTFQAAWSKKTWDEIKLG